MAEPFIYTPTYSYSGYQASNPTRPLPAPKVDNDFAKISQSTSEIALALRDIRRSDGKLQNGLVTIQSLESSLSALIAAVPGLAAAAAVSAANAAASAGSAAVSASAASASAGVATAAAQRALENATGLVIATQAQAEAGVLNDKGMTPLRTRQAVVSQVPFRSDDILNLGDASAPDTALQNTSHGYLPGKQFTNVFERQIADGEHLVVDAAEYAKIVNSGATSMRFFALPRWIENVTAIELVRGVDLSHNSAPTPGSTRASVKLTLAAPRQVQKGDLLKLVSDDLTPFSQLTDGGGVRRNGEFVVVGVSSTGSEVWLTGRLAETGVNPYATNPRLVALADARLTLNGGSFDVTDAKWNAPGTGNGFFVEATGLSRVRLRMGSVKRSITRVVRVIGCFDVAAEATSSAKLRNDGINGNLGYGIDITSSENCRVYGFNTVDARHAITTNSTGVAAGATGVDVHKFGRTRGLIVSGVNALASSNAGLDTHMGVDGAVFSDCIIKGSYRGASSSGNVINARGKNVSFRDIFGDNCVGGAHFATTEGGHAVDLDLRRISGLPVRIGPDSQQADLADYSALIEDSYIELENQDEDFEFIRMVTDVGKVTKGTFRRCVFKVKGGTYNNTTLNILSPGGKVDVRFEDCIIDISEMSLTSSVRFFRINDPGVIISGNVRIIAGPHPIEFLFSNGSGAPTPVQAEVRLNIDYEGDNDLPGVTGERFFGINPANFPKVYLTGSKTIAGVRTIAPYKPSTAYLTKPFNLTTDALLSGAKILLDRATAGTVTLHADAPSGFEMEFTNINAGQWTFTAASGATVASFGSVFKTAGLNAKVRAECVRNTGGAAQWVISGNLVA